MAKGMDLKNRSLALSLPLQRAVNVSLMVTRMLREAEAQTP